ncbi:2-dehydro-3-deoxygluconokinase [compost metagenome]
MDFHDRLAFENKSNDLLAVGELLVDMISNEYDDTFQSAGYTKFPGGSPSNIAVNVKKLGLSSIIVSAVGEDGFGKFLVNRLRTEGIETLGIQQSAAPTSLVVVSKSKATPIPIFYRGADYQLAYTPTLQDALRNSKVVHFSCWPVSRLPSRHTIERMIAEARQQGMLIGFDPNYHSAIWQEGEDGVQYVKDLISKVDIIKPSEDDAERLFGRDTPYRQLEKFLELGAKLVILTLGENGAIVSNGRETRIFETLATDVVDTTGAGDAFWSGFYTAAVKGYTLQEALNLGFAVSAFKLKYTGAVVDLPKIEDIQAYYNL